MAYLDTTGLNKLWDQIKAKFARQIGATHGSDAVTIKLKNAAGTDLDSGSTTLNAASTTSAGVMTSSDKSNLNTLTVTDSTKANKIWGGDSTGLPGWISAPETGVTKVVAGTNVTVSPTTGTGEVTVNATDTTYSDMTGATSSSAGVHGLVPAPASGEQNYFLRGDGDWVANPGVFIATYDSTSFAECLAAYNAGKMVYCFKGNNNIYPVVYVSSSTFSFGFTECSILGIITIAIELDSSGWSDTSSTETIPTKLSDLTADSTHRLVTDTEKSTWNSKQDTITFNTTYSATTNKAATMSDINSAVTGAAKYQGTLASEAALTALTNYKQGWYYIASASWTSSSLGITLDTGNLILAKADGATYSASDFDVVQSDIEAIPNSVIEALT